MSEMDFADELGVHFSFHLEPIVTIQLDDNNKIHNSSYYSAHPLVDSVTEEESIVNRIDFLRDLLNLFRKYSDHIFEKFPLNNFKNFISHPDQTPIESAFSSARTPKNGHRYFPRKSCSIHFEYDHHSRASPNLIKQLLVQP